MTTVLVGYIGLSLSNHTLIYLEGYPRSVLNNGAYQWAKLRAMKKIARIDFLAYQGLETGQLVQLIENGATATWNILNNFVLDTLRCTILRVIISFAFINEVCFPISNFSFAYTTYKLDSVAFQRFSQFLALPEDP
jgi:hypothetical protein